MKRSDACTLNIPVMLSSIWLFIYELGKKRMPLVQSNGNGCSIMLVIVVSFIDRFIFGLMLIFRENVCGAWLLGFNRNIVCVFGVGWVCFMDGKLLTQCSPPVPSRLKKKKKMMVLLLCWTSSTWCFGHCVGRQQTFFWQHTWMCQPGGAGLLQQPEWAVARAKDEKRISQQGEKY